ncbi:MAG: glycosyltransferase family 39 protein [Micrococcaceae bacterium]|nr:glycosyltransferase family 39 protein [Micrococcaceae bacterium]
MMHCGVWERSSTAPRMTAPSLGRHTEEGFRAIRRRRGVNLRGGARTRSQVGRSGEALDNTVHDEARQVSSSSVGNPRSGPRVMRSAVPRTADQQSHSAPWRRSTGSKGLAAWEYAFGSLTLSMGHVFLTASVDLFVWPAVILAVMRALLRGRPWWWLVAGTIAALSLYNKFLIVMLLAALAIGLLALGPRRAVWSPWVLGGRGPGSCGGPPEHHLPGSQWMAAADHGCCPVCPQCRQCPPPHVAVSASDAGSAPGAVLGRRFGCPAPSP